MFSCVVHANDHPHDSDTVFLDRNFHIKKIYKKNSKKFKINNAISGIYFAQKKFLNYLNFRKGKSYDLVHDIVPELIKLEHKVSAYKTIEYIKDFGTLNRIKIVKKDIRKNKIKNLNFLSKTKSVFLDRDGVINQENSKANTLKNFKILPNIQKAISKLNNNKIPCFIVTNQAGLAKGEFNLIELFKIISKLDKYLYKNEAYIDDFLICPHFTNKKYKNTNISFFSEYRKPNPGMITTLANKYRINLKSSFMIGDSDRDILAGKNAAVKTILVESPKIKDYKLNVKPNFKTTSLWSAVNLVLKKIN